MLITDWNMNSFNLTGTRPLSNGQYNFHSSDQNNQHDEDQNNQLYYYRNNQRYYGRNNQGDNNSIRAKFAVGCSPVKHTTTYIGPIRKLSAAPSLIRKPYSQTYFGSILQIKLRTSLTLSNSLGCKGRENGEIRLPIQTRSETNKDRPVDVALLPFGNILFTTKTNPDNRGPIYPAKKFIHNF